MELFQLVVLVVSITSIVLAGTSLFRVNKAIEELQHDGRLWFYKSPGADLDEQVNGPPARKSEQRAA